MPSRVCSESNSSSATAFWPTLNRASSGQGWNQSMTVQFTRAGNLRQRLRKSSPTGEQQRIMCRLRRTMEMK